MTLSSVFVISIAAFCSDSLSALAFTAPTPLPTALRSRTIHPVPSTKSGSSCLFSNNNKVGIFEEIANVLDTSYATFIDLLFYGKLPEPLPEGMRRVPTQFIAALGDPTSSSSNSGAEQWGIWTKDPGPPGFYLNELQKNPSSNRYKFDPNDFWIEEYGRVMSKPEFPLNPGRYVVTGGRDVTTLLTVDSPDSKGRQAWRLEDGTLFDVTHLPCRSARYFPKRGQEGKRSPADANWADFPVRPGAAMPDVAGCDKRDYAVLFVIAIEK